MSSIFGPMFAPHTLVVEAQDLLEKYFPPYLRELELRNGFEQNTLKAPQNYTQRNNFTNLPGEELPKCVVLSPGIAGPANKDGSGMYRGVWRLGVGVAIAGKTEEEAYTLSSIYGAAVRSILLDHQNINGVASGVTYVDENYDDLPTSTEIQKLRAVSVWFAVNIDNVAKRSAGPQDPANVYGIAEEVVITNDRLS